jgi:hypothetical protein
MPIVAERGWVAIRRDRRIHTRPLEVRVFSEVGLRTGWLGGKKDMSSHQQLDLIIRYWKALEHRREDLGPGPWSVTLLGSVLSPRVWRPERQAFCTTSTSARILSIGLSINSSLRVPLESSVRTP